MRLTKCLGCLSKLPKNYANFPEKYVKKQTEFIEFKTPRMKNFERKTIRYRKYAYYDIHAPWTKEFHRQNEAGTRIPKIYVEPMENPCVFLGDRVEILRGKDKGKQGVVSFVVPERNWVCVEGLNLKREIITKEDLPTIVSTTEEPLLYKRDVLLVDPEDNLPTDVEWRYDEEGKQVRVSKRSERNIPLPLSAFKTVDYLQTDHYVDQEKDTSPEEVEKSTFSYKLKTFEMDLMDEMGVKEDRVPFPMYWY